MIVTALKSFLYSHITGTRRTRKARAGQIITDFPEENIDSLIEHGYIKMEGAEDQEGEHADIPEKKSILEPEKKQPKLKPKPKTKPKVKSKPKRKQ